MEARVRGVGAVVPHHPHGALRNGDVEVLAAGGVAGLQVRLEEGGAVDGHALPLVAAPDAVAGQPDDPLDQVVLRVVGQQADEHQPLADRCHDGPVLGLRHDVEPAARVGEHHDVAPLEVDRPRGQLADDDPVVEDEGVLHGSGRDVEGLQQPRLDDERQHERHSDHDDELPARRAQHGADAVTARGPSALVARLVTGRRCGSGVVVPVLRRRGGVVAAPALRVPGTARRGGCAGPRSAGGCAGCSSAGDCG